MRKGFKKGFKQGIYTPVNPEKWILTEAFDSKGKPQIKYRSGWEYKFMQFADHNPGILKVNSEGVIIPYYNPVKQKKSRYYMDFIIETKEDIFLVEVKPKAQCKPPVKPKNSTDKSRLSYEKAIETYVINQAKWEATEEFCKVKGWKFMIITEDHLGL